MKKQKIQFLSVQKIPRTEARQLTGGCLNCFHWPPYEPCAVYIPDGCRLMPGCIIDCEWPLNGD